MKKGNLISTIAFIFSIMLLIVSGAIYVYSAQQQSVSSSLQVTFSGENVDFTVQGWYHIKGDANNNTSKVAMVNSSGQTSGITFSATDAPKTETLKINNTESENKAILTATQDYVLFTYKFVNTASDGAFGMEVTLNLTNVTGSNLKAVKYGTDTTLYTDSNLGTVCNGLSTFSTPSEGTMKIFDADFIAANNGMCYYYILLQLDDPTLPVTFNPTFSWTVECSDDTAQQITNYTVTLTGDMFGTDYSHECLYQVGSTVVNPPEETGNPSGWTSLASESSGYTVSVQAGQKIFFTHRVGGSPEYIETHDNYKLDFYIGDSDSY